MVSVRARASTNEANEANVRAMRARAVDANEPPRGGRSRGRVGCGGPRQRGNGIIASCGRALVALALASLSVTTGVRALYGAHRGGSWYGATEHETLNGGRFDVAAALGSHHPLAGYIQHPSRVVVGGETNLGRRLNDTLSCKSECDKMGNPCAGFVHDIAAGYCTIVGRGYGLQVEAESDFYRKKMDPSSARWTVYTGQMMPSPDVMAWKGFNGSISQAKVVCAGDSLCQGFYTCPLQNGTEDPNCPTVLNTVHAQMDLLPRKGDRLFDENNPSPPPIVLLSGISTAGGFEPDERVDVYSRSTPTCEGTAKGAPCAFPFYNDVSDTQLEVEFFEPTYAGGSRRPWCYTAKPGLWGYVDCGNYDPFGTEWRVGNWSNCPVSCGRGLRTRSVECVKKQTGEPVDASLCGKRPSSSENCNTHSCVKGCEPPGNITDIVTVWTKKACGAYYDDVRSQFRSKAIQRDACEEYKCCWDTSAVHGHQCYKSMYQDPDPAGCAKGYDGALYEAHEHTAMSTISMCDDRCCRGDRELGRCAFALGYANPSKANPCERYINAKNTSVTEWSWHGPNKYATCSFIESSEAKTSVDCKASCRIVGGCNTINFNRADQVCDLLDCGFFRSPKFMHSRLIELLNFEVYVWNAASKRHWEVGEWGECNALSNPSPSVSPSPSDSPSPSAYPSNAYPSNAYPSNAAEHLFDHTQEEQDIQGMMARLGLKSPVCRMVRRRPVRCLDENNQVVPDDDCLKGWKQLSGKSAGKPPVFQRCWAACGITNRTCEDLQWEPSSVKKRGVSGDTRTCGSLQEGGKYPNGCWADYGPIKLPDGRSFRGEQAISLVKAEEACGMSGARLCTVEELHKGVVGGKIKDYRTRSNKRCRGNYYWTSTPCANGAGVYVAGTEYGSITQGMCVSPNATHLPACCSTYGSVPTPIEREIAKVREIMNVTNGEYGYCSGSSRDDLRACNVGEGHARGGSDCGFNTMPAQRAGEKYGLPVGSTACQSKYDVDQITFRPSWIQKDVKTDMVFTAAGNAEIPENAIVRIVLGFNPGCIGVADGSAQVIAENTLSRQGEERVREAPLPNMFNNLPRSQNYDATLHTTEVKYMHWRDLIIDGLLGMDTAPYEVTVGHVCMCDVLDGCDQPRSWNDLGRVDIDPAMEYFAPLPSYVRVGGKYRYFSNVVAVGGNLYESYTSADVEKIYPGFRKYHWDHHSRGRAGKWSVLTSSQLHMEYCAQKCLANTNCHSFDFHFKDHSNWRSRICYLRDDTAKYKMIRTGSWRSSTVYTRRDDKREDFWWYPSLNFSHTSIMRKNPTSFGEWNGGAPTGVGGDVWPNIVPFQNPNGTLSFERLRVLGLPRYTGVQVSHAGSGEVLPPFLGSHPPSVNNGFNAPYVGDSATHQSGAWVAYHQEFIAACKAGMTFHVKNASYVDYRNPRYYKEVNMNNCRKPNDVTVAKVKQVCEGKSQCKLPSQFMRDMGAPCKASRYYYGRLQVDYECVPSSAPLPYFQGGAYVPHKRPTCGGNSNGAPCISHLDITINPVDDDYFHMGCFKPEGWNRPMCYTSSDKSYWGFCDCHSMKWTRPFPTGQNTKDSQILHNSAFRGDEVYSITDQVYGPITNLHCPNNADGAWRGRCEFGADESMCLKKQTYSKFQTVYRKYDTKTFCPPGQVLTGFALLGKNGKMVSGPHDGVMLRCGEPAGFKILMRHLIKIGFHVTAAGKLTTSYSSDRREEYYARRSMGGDWVSCPRQTIAVGFQFRSQKSPRDGRDGALLCGAVQYTDPTNPEFKRACLNMVCTGSQEILSIGLHECVKACSLRPNCTSAEVTNENTCVLRNGSCQVSDNPYGVASRNSDMRETLLAQSASRAVFSSVEYDHPVNRSGLQNFIATNVPSSHFIRTAQFRWFGTPWSGCVDGQGEPKECGTGINRRKVFCASVENATLPAAVNPSLCNPETRIPDKQYCNSFHCELQCRQDSNRATCLRFDRDERRAATSTEIRRTVCESYGCCFVHDPTPDNLRKEPECYEKPRRLVPEWISMPYGGCSRNCNPVQSESAQPIANRRNVCMWSNGTTADRQLCAMGIDMPDTESTCNLHESCEDGSSCHFRVGNRYLDLRYRAENAWSQRQHCCETDSCCTSKEAGYCGFGKCERVYDAIDTYKFHVQCTCADGYSRTMQGSSPQAVNSPCLVSQPKCQPVWTTSSWTECRAAVPPASGGVQTRRVTCSCHDTCDESQRPVDVRTCEHFDESLQKADEGLPQDWNKTKIPPIKDIHDYVLFEHRTMAVSARFPASVSTCLAACTYKPRCPGVVFSGFLTGGTCGLIAVHALNYVPFQRTGESGGCGCSSCGAKAASSHVFMRRAFLMSYPQPLLIRAIEDLGNRTEWSSALGEAVVLSNERLTRLTSNVASNDPIWRWIQDSLGAQGVPLRKSLYSLALPLHPNVVPHVRYLYNFMSTEHNTTRAADAVLAFAYKYRDLDWLVNSTSSRLNSVRESKLITERCKYSNMLTNRDSGVTKMPSLRDDNPSPLQALHHLLTTQRNMDAIPDFPLDKAPWPLLAVLNTAQFPTRECNWIWDRKHGTGDNEQRSWTKTGGFFTRWYTYTFKFEKNAVVCKESNWHPSAIPRIAEDGGLCGRLSYLYMGEQSCRGTPSAMVTQPKHAAAFSFGYDGGGQWRFDKKYWITDEYFTWSENALPTDDVAGVGKLKPGAVDYMVALPRAMSIGLDSYTDVRLAMLLFRNVYSNGGDQYLNVVARVLLSALEKNPHNIEAFELLFAHFSLGTLTDPALMDKAYRIFEPYKQDYQQTYEKLLNALASIYDCKESNATLIWIENEIEEMAPGCDNLSKRMSIRSGAIMTCYVQYYGTGLDLVKSVFENEILQVAWNSCDDNGSSEFNLHDPALLRTKSDPVSEKAIKKVLGMMFGGPYPTSTGLAGSNRTAVYDYLLELRGKFPVAGIKTVRSCSYGSGSGEKQATESSMARWEIDGMVPERKSHAALMDQISKYARDIGMHEKYRELKAKVDLMRKSPVSLRVAKRLTATDDASWNKFLQCTNTGGASAAMLAAADDKSHGHDPLFVSSQLGISCGNNTENITMSRYRYSAATVGRCASAHDVKPLDLSLRGRYVNEASPPDVHIVAMNSTDKEKTYFIAAWLFNGNSSDSSHYMRFNQCRLSKFYIEKDGFNCKLVDESVGYKRPASGASCDFSDDSVKQMWNQRSRMYHASSALSSGWGIHSLKFRNCPTGARSEEHARDILAEKRMADDAFESDEFDPKEYNVVTFGTPDDHAVFGVAHSSVDFNVTHLNGACAAGCTRCNDDAGVNCTMCESGFELTPTHSCVKISLLNVEQTSPGNSTVDSVVRASREAEHQSQVEERSSSAPPQSIELVATAKMYSGTMNETSVYSPATSNSSTYDDLFDSTLSEVESPDAQAPGESSATLSPTPSPSDEDDSGANMYSLERDSSRCVGIELKRLQRTKSLEKCFKAVKERGGLYFAYRSSNGVCYEQPKPWSECRRIKRGPYDLYNMKAEPALGHAEPALGHTHEREISMLCVALTIGTCAMAFIAERVHRRAKRWTNIEESRTLDPRDKISYGAVV